MATRKLLVGLLSVALAVPSNAAISSSGTVRGVISLSGRAIEGLSVTLVNVETGRSYSVRSGADGGFTASLPPGSYVVLSPGRSGVAIARAPLSIDVVSGKTASASIEVASLAVQAAQSPTGSATIKHDAADCITEGEFTLIEATFEPLSAVVNGRLYFQSNLSPEWFYTEFEKIEPPVPGGPTHRAFIPKVNKDGGIETINYYIQVTSSDFAETKSDEHAVKVVENASECKGKMAPIGNPEGAVSVLSASGAAAGSLAGFGGIAGVGLGAAAIGGIIAGVVLGGVALKEATNNDATPTPTPVTTPTATPTPVITPTPVPLCPVTVLVSPDAPAPVGLEGRLCSVQFHSPNGNSLGTVFNSRTFNVPCNQNVAAYAIVAPESSAAGAGPKPAFWTQGCGNSALGAPCVIQPTLPSSGTTIALQCTQ